MAQKEKSYSAIGRIKGWWKDLWTLKRWANAFRFACAIGVGYYLGEVFFRTNLWFVGIILTMFFLALIGGNTLDTLLGK